MQSLADIKLSDTDPLHSTGTGSGEAAWHQPTTRYTPANQQHATASISTATASRRASNSGDTYEIRVHYPESRVDNHVLGREYLVYRITVTHIHTDGTTDQTVAYRRYSVCTYESACADLLRYLTYQCIVCEYRILNGCMRSWATPTSAI